MPFLCSTLLIVCDISGIDGPSLLTLNVGNSLNRKTHSRCGVWRGDLERQVKNREEVVITCEAVARYLSLKIKVTRRVREFCELIVIGNQYTSKWSIVYSLLNQLNNIHSAQ